MEVRKPHIKSIPYDEWNDNSSLEKIVDELHEGGVNVVTGSLDQLINWGRSNSLWSLTFATSCCGIEFMACGCARYDFARFGFEVTRNSPRQADLIMCAGTITHTQDGPRTEASVRRDGRAEVCYRRRWLRHQRWSIQVELPCSEGYRGDRARRRIHPWLSPTPRGYHVRHDAVAA